MCPNTATPAPRFIAELTIAGHITDMGVRFHLLQLENGISGKVLLIMTDRATPERTKFLVSFRDAVWEQPEWFEAL